MYTYVYSVGIPNKDINFGSVGFVGFASHIGTTRLLQIYLFTYVENTTH